MAWIKPLLTDTGLGDAWADTPGMVNDLVDELRDAVDAIVGGGGGGGVGTHTHTTVAHEHLIEDREIITVEEGTQVIIFAANRYTPSSGEIKVWINGQLVRSGYAFTESGVDRVTMTGLPIKTGDWFYAEITKAATLTSSNEVEP